jgi:crossover junction endodeoxyribonuclease RuvC
MILLGIDPGFADMGYGVIESVHGKQRCIAYGSIRTSPETPFPERLARIYDRLSDIVAQHKPERAAMERLYFSTNVKTALNVAEARGVIRVCLEKLRIPCREFNPADVKIAVCGHGTAEKTAVQKMTQVLLKLPEIPKPDDAADALAIAVTLAVSAVHAA